ncbi:MAG: T9SS type A sorting domain-containing protein [Melioribacteraceae bacterium]|nr:T9SS type A sorting domain-containing protein [Melioribacteraceae bacterium]
MKIRHLLLLIITINIYAQHNDGLRVMPRYLHFKDNFNRSKLVRVANDSQEIIKIDSIKYDADIYAIRLNTSSSFPIELSPGNGFTFEVIQYNYFSLGEDHANSVITIYNNSEEPVINIETEHENFQIHHSGNINGIVKDSSSFLQNAKVYFFYDQLILIDSALTDENGNFSAELPVGNYFTAAFKDGYYMQFANGKDSPIGADIIELNRDETINLEFTLEEETETDFGIEGTITDIETATLKKSIVVIRKGTHTPTKITAGQDDDLNRSYTTLTDKNGNYEINNIKFPDDYYVQAFAPLTIPGYYNMNNTPAVFWQDADSLNISGRMSNIDIVLLRDSSFGAGFVEGSVLSNSGNSPVNDALVYLKSITDEKIYTYDVVSSQGSFAIPILPVGIYEIIAQKIGVQNSTSNLFEISTTADSLTGINITLIVTSVEDNFIPPEFELKQNYPNPFNPSTTIEFTLSEVNPVELNIYDALGQKIATLISSTMEAGSYKYQYDASNLATGIYFYELKVGNNNSVKKMNLIK